MSRKDLKAKPVSVYLPQDLYQKLQTKAEQEVRTLSQTAIYILTEYFKPQDT